MVSPLRRVMVESPQAAGWFAEEQADPWRELGFLRQPDAGLAQTQHNELRAALITVGVEVVLLGAGEELSPDAVYVHDPSLLTDYGAVCLRMAKPNRVLEPQHHCKRYQSLGIPVLGEIAAPGIAEAGDMVWLDRATLLVGHGHRTNAAGIEQLCRLLAPKGIEVFSAPLPYGPGPGSCLHLMSLISLLDEHTAVVDLSWLSVSAVELLRERKFRLIEIDPAERDSLACNVLALGDGKLLAFEESRTTNARLRNHGFDVITIPGSEMGVIGGGGPTCLTRPLLRA